MSTDREAGGPDRRDFIGSVAGLTLAARAPVGTRDQFDASSNEPAEVTLARRYQAQTQETWNMSWVDRITSKHRQVFDAPEIAEGTVLHQTRTYIRGFADVYGAADSDCSCVMVIRHAAIPMVANDRLWDELSLGKEFKLKDPESGKPARRNPFLNANTPPKAKYGLLWPDGGLDLLIKRGVIALCCNIALYRLVHLVKERDKVDDKAAGEKVLANLVPGVIVQPSGIFAVARAQEAGCNYIRSA